MSRAYRRQWLKQHDKYENRARIIFQRAFKTVALTIPFSEMQEDNYKVFTEFYITRDVVFKAYLEVYTQVGGIHGKRVGREINKQINEKDFTFDKFLSVFQRTLIAWLNQNGGQRITEVRGTYIAYINQLIANGVRDGKTMPQIATGIKKLIASRNFYRWQALRIARTETTTASNYAASVASSVSGVLMDKVWLSGQDPRTRRPPDSKYDHFSMNLVKVPLDKPFTVSGEKMMFAGDPKGSAGNVINCRCTVAQVVRRDKNGRIIRVPEFATLP